jgi:cholesterol transport system auxiliary component
MKTGLPLVALSLALAGCVNFADKPNTPAVVYYVLQDASLKNVAPLRDEAQMDSYVLKDAEPLRAKVPQGGMASYAPQGDSDFLRAEARERSAPTLLVLDTTTGGFYDTDQLVFSRSAGTRGQYQFARWTERPGKRFADLMRERLDRQGMWRVSAAGGYVRGDVLLDTELVEFYHDARSEPGQMRLVLRAELVDLKQRKLLGRRVFEQSAPLATFDAAGAAQASSRVVGRALDDLSAWLANIR